MLAATAPVAIGVAVAAGIILWWFKKSITPKPDNSKEKRDELQKVSDRIQALPPEYMQNLRYHYCKLKNNNRLIDFSYHPKPALRNQADTIELTLEGIAATVLDGSVDFKEFKRLHGPFVLRAWVLCKEDVRIKAEKYPRTGAKFKQLAKKIGKTIEEIGHHTSQET